MVRTSMSGWMQKLVRSRFGQFEIGSDQSMSRRRKPKKKIEALPEGFVEVDNPYFQRGYDETADNVSKITVAVGDDILWGMLSRNQIDKAQFEAGRMWQRYHERAEIGGANAIDPTKEAVDGGKIPEPITDSQIDAIRKLNEAREVLGARNTSLIYEILGSGKTFSNLAVEWCCDRKELGNRFRFALEVVANIWGLTTRRKRLVA